MSKAAPQSEVTDWFYSPIKPARPGVYQVEWVTGCPVFSRFDYGVWHFGFKKDIDAASRIVVCDRNNPPKRWRGLAQDPKAAA